MVRGQRACSFPCPGCAGLRREPAGWPRFPWLFMIAKAFAPIPGIRSFTIMKCLLKRHARKPHPPPRAHLPRVPGALIADLIIVGRSPGMAWVTATVTGVVKAVTHGAGGRGGNLQVILRRVLRRFGLLRSVMVIYRCLPLVYGSVIGQ